MCVTHFVVEKCSKSRERAKNKENLDPVSRNIVGDRIGAASLVTRIVRMQIFLSMLIRLIGFHLDAFDTPRLAAGAKRTTDKGNKTRVFAPDARVARTRLILRRADGCNRRDWSASALR